jgi:hypothetical protein
MRDRTTKILFYTIIGLLTYSAALMLLPRLRNPIGYWDRSHWQWAKPFQEYVQNVFKPARQRTPAPGPDTPFQKYVGDVFKSAPERTDIAKGHVAFPLELEGMVSGFPMPGTYFDLAWKEDGRNSSGKIISRSLLLVAVNVTDENPGLKITMILWIPKEEVGKLTAAQKTGTLRPMLHWPPDDDSKTEGDEGEKDASKNL